MIRVKVPLAFLFVETVLLEAERELEAEEAAASVAAAFRTLFVNMEVMRSCPFDSRVDFFGFFPIDGFSVGCEEGITAGSA